MGYKKLYEDLLQEYEELKRLYGLIEPKNNTWDSQVMDYVSWYMEHYGHRPSSRLIEKFKELNGGVVYEHDKSH